MTDHAHHHTGLSVGKYVQVATLLTVITLAELGIIYEPVKLFVRENMAWFIPLTIPTLLVLSAIKFLGVIGFYMHLRFDAGYYRAVFGGPLIGALLLVIVVMLLYGTSLFRGTYTDSPDLHSAADYPVRPAAPV
jgi:hypothetical protein